MSSLGNNQFSNPVTPEERAEIIRLHGEGKGRNEISRLVGRAPRIVSVVCAQEGLTFDTTMTEEATRHRTAQLAALRAEAALDLHIDAMRLTQQIWEPGKVYSFGGSQNTYAEHDVPEPPPIDKRNLMQAAGIAYEKSLKLVPPTGTPGENEARSMLGALAESLNRLADGPGEDDTGEG